MVDVLQRGHINNGDGEANERGGGEWGDMQVVRSARNGERDVLGDDFLSLRQEADVASYQGVDHGHIFRDGPRRLRDVPALEALLETASVPVDVAHVVKQHHRRAACERVREVLVLPSWTRDVRDAEVVRALLEVDGVVRALAVEFVEASRDQLEPGPRDLEDAERVLDLLGGRCVDRESGSRLGKGNQGKGLMHC